MSGETSIKYAYDPDSAESRYMRKYLLDKWRTATEVFGIAIMLLFLYLIVKITVREYGSFFRDLHPVLMELMPLVFWAGIVLGLVAALLCSLLVNRLHDTILEVEREEEGFRKGPIYVTLDAEGVHSSTDGWSQFVAWKGVHRVVTTPQGLGLRMDNQTFVPVLADRLPDGLTTEEVLAKIEEWRGSRT